MYLRVFRGVDYFALPVHDPVHRDARDNIGLNELEMVHKLCRGSRELRLFQR